MFRSVTIAYLGLAAGMLLGCSSEEGSPTPATGEPSGTAPTESRDLGPVQDLLLRTRREKRVRGKPEWMVAGDVNGDGTPEVIAAVHSPGAILLWREPMAEPEYVPVGDFPLRPAPLPATSGTVTWISVASRAERSLVLLDLSTPGRHQELFRDQLPDVPMVLSSGILSPDRGQELFVVTRAGTLVRAGAQGVTSLQELERPVPRCMTVLQPETGLVIGFQSSDTLEVYGPAQGQENLAHLHSFSLPGTPRDLLGLDVDRDGDRELIVIAGDQGGWIFGIGCTDPFDVDHPPVRFKTTAIPVRLLAMESKARARWSVLAASSVACEIWEWLGTRAERQLYSYAGQTPRDMVLQDAQGDGRADFWVANRDAHVISLLRNGEKGPIQPRKIGVGAFPNDMATGDMDGDGLHELFVINAKDNDISVLLRHQGTMRKGFDISTGPSPRAVLTADVDGDGALDILWLERTHSSTRLNLRLGDGKRGLRAPAGFEPLPLGIGSRDFVVENFNGDPRSLVVAVDPDARRLLWTHVEGGAQGLLHTPIEELELAGPPRSIATMFQGSTARGIAVAMQTSHDRSLLEIYSPATREDGRIEWRKLSEISLAGAVIDVACGDLDGNGIDDIAYLAADHEGAVSGNVQTVLVLGGKPQRVGMFATDLRPQRILLEDLSGDGRAEIFVANLDSHNVNVWLTVGGDEGLKFRRLDDVGAGVGCIDLAATDLDGDGDFDLVVVDSANDGVSLIVNETR